MNEETHTRKHLRHARATPLASTLTILSFASRAFAFYYFLQCLVAICVSEKTWQKAAIGILAAVLAFITLFAVPAG